MISCRRVWVGRERAFSSFRYSGYESVQTSSRRSYALSADQSTAVARASHARSHSTVLDEVSLRSLVTACCSSTCLFMTIGLKRSHPQPGASHNKGCRTSGAEDFRFGDKPDTASELLRAPVCRRCATSRKSRARESDETPSPLGGLPGGPSGAQIGGRSNYLVSGTHWALVLSYW